MIEGGEGRSYIDRINASTDLTVTALIDPIFDRNRTLHSERYAILPSGGLLADLLVTNSPPEGYSDIFSVLEI